MLFRACEPDPQGLKPASIAALDGTAEAVPYPKPICEATSSYFSFSKIASVICTVEAAP